MEISLSVLGIAGAIALGAISPGPSFVLVARTAVASSRADGLAAALGMGAGGVLFAGAALLGLHVVLNAVPGLYLGLRLLGGAYLILLGCMIWRGARKPLRLAEPAGRASISRATATASRWPLPSARPVLPVLPILHILQT